VFGQTAAVISASSSQHVVVLLTSALAVKFDTRMQPRLNTVAEAAGLFNLHPMAVINLHCIPTLVVVEMQPRLSVVVEMQPRLRNRLLFLKKRPAAGGTSVGTSVARQAVPEGLPC